MVSFAYIIRWAYGNHIDQTLILFFDLSEYHLERKKNYDGGIGHTFCRDKTITKIVNKGSNFHAQA